MTPLLSTCLQLRVLEGRVQNLLLPPSTHTFQPPYPSARLRQPSHCLALHRRQLRLSSFAVVWQALLSPCRRRRSSSAVAVRSALLLNSPAALLLCCSLFSPARHSVTFQLTSTQADTSCPNLRPPSRRRLDSRNNPAILPKDAELLLIVWDCCS